MSPKANTIIHVIQVLIGLEFIALYFFQRDPLYLVFAAIMIIQSFTIRILTKKVEMLKNSFAQLKAVTDEALAMVHQERRATEHLMHELPLDADGKPYVPVPGMFGYTKPNVVDGRPMKL